MSSPGLACSCTAQMIFISSAFSCPLPLNQAEPALTAWDTLAKIWNGMEEVTLFIYLNACAIQMGRKIWKSKENQSKTSISFLKNEGRESTEGKQ